MVAEVNPLARFEPESLPARILLGQDRRVEPSAAQESEKFAYAERGAQGSSRTSGQSPGRRMAYSHDCCVVSDYKPLYKMTNVATVPHYVPHYGSRSLVSTAYCPVTFPPARRRRRTELLKCVRHCGAGPHLATSSTLKDPLDLQAPIG